MLWQFLCLLGVHWVADFVCQTHWQASNKSRDNEALLRHVAIYTVILGGCVPAIFPVHTWMPAAFVALNGVLHFTTDYFTSRASSKLYAKQDWHNFFVVIGFDQLIHQVTLATTMAWMING